jgi:hypothetical protein
MKDEQAKNAAKTAHARYIASWDAAIRTATAIAPEAAELIRQRQAYALRAQAQ